MRTLALLAAVVLAACTDAEPSGPPADDLIFAAVEGDGTLAGLDGATRPPLPTLALS